MSVFGKILEKLGFKKPAAEQAAPADKPAGLSISRDSEVLKAKKPAQAMEMVDVVGKLDGMAKANPQELNWRVSIVDLLKLLDIDSSLDNRTELAKELGVPQDKMGGDHAEMNMWLHKEVMKKLAHNGGNVPKELLD